MCVRGDAQWSPVPVVVSDVSLGVDLTLLWALSLGRARKMTVNGEAMGSKMASGKAGQHTQL